MAAVVVEDAAESAMVLADAAQTALIPSMHQDYLHCLAVDSYGRRVASAAGDRMVHVWELQEDGRWCLTAAFSAHRSAVNGLHWAHPEFGSLLATAGVDHDVKIWEERGGGVGSLQSRWTCKASLTEARRAVSSVEFAPRHWGLKLAAGSADGCVRIYEAIDIMNLAQWPVSATLESFAESTGCRSVSWSTGRFEPPTLVAGGSHLVIYRYSEAARSWQSVLQIPASGGHVLDVAWAPNVGRRFHCIAAAEEDRLCIHRLTRGSSGQQQQQDGKKSDKTSPTLESTQIVDSNAWRCQWNVTGTVLASSGDKGVVHLWKADADGQFGSVGKVQGDLTQLAAVQHAS
jgi:nucleoporin SEH1